METIYFAGGCLWGVQYFVKRLPGVISTEAGRVNGNRGTLGGPYDGYAECVKTVFDPEKVSLEKLLEWFFEIIDPFSIDHQGMDYGHKYRTGVYSQNPDHLNRVRDWIAAQSDSQRIRVEVLPLTSYTASAPEHQDRLDRCPRDWRLCSIPRELMDRSRKA